MTEPPLHSYAADHALAATIRQAVTDAGGWLPFDRFMHLALYTPNLGYYARNRNPLGHWPGDGSDFVTAPELSPLFGQTLVVQVQDALQSAGFSPGAIDGVLAPPTLAAVARYQQARGLPVHGYLDVETVRALGVAPN